MNKIDEKLNFQISNTYRKVDLEKPASGIGIKNLKRRLELLYPSKHELDISENEGVFTAKLILPIQWIFVAA